MGGRERVFSVMEASKGASRVRRGRGEQGRDGERDKGKGRGEKETVFRSIRGFQGNRYEEGGRETGKRVERDIETVRCGVR